MTTTTTNPQLTIKDQKQKMVDQLITDCSIFFAFSNEQFAENKTPLAEGEKYVSIGSGGYMPKGNIDKWDNGWKAINAWYKQAGKDKKARAAHIAYELNNYEAFYVGDIEDTLNALGEGYTAKEVWAVYHKIQKQYA